jgi:uncharacterized membrane protein (DUF106 family)
MPSLEQILQGIQAAANTMRELREQVNTARETLNSADSAQVDAALKALQEENDRLHETVSAKLDAASRQ